MLWINKKLEEHHVVASSVWQSFLSLRARQERWNKWLEAWRLKRETKILIIQKNNFGAVLKFYEFKQPSSIVEFLAWRHTKMTAKCPEISALKISNFIFHKVFYLSPCKNLFWIAKFLFQVFSSPYPSLEMSTMANEQLLRGKIFPRGTKCSHNPAPLKMKTKPGNSIHIAAVTFIHKTFFMQKSTEFF